MGVFTFASEYVVSIPPTKLFNAYVLKRDTLFPKVIPHAVKSIEILEGDGGVGTIEKVIFGDASPQHKNTYGIHKIELVDKEALVFKFTVIEGAILMGEIEKISFENKIDASENGGSIYKQTRTYYTKGDFVIQGKEVKFAEEKEKIIFKAVEDYVLANPNEF